MPTPPVRAAAYYRMSTLRQEDSPERQRSQVEPYAAKCGYAVVKTYLDEGLSGTETTKRKAFQQLLRDAQAGAFDVILCDDKDRFGRFDSIDLGEIVAPLRRKGVWMETVAQGRIDWNSFAGRITDAVTQEARHEEQAAISRRVLSSQLLKAQRGIDTGGRPLYGYRWEPDPERGKRRVPDGRKADVVRLVFTMYDRGHTLYAVAEELYRRGVPSPRGRIRWTRTVLQRLLNNRKYVGDGTWGVHPQGKRHRYAAGGVRATERGKKAPRLAPAEEWLVRPNDHEPLVDRDLFERVQARLRGNRVRTAPHPGGSPFVLSRLLVCSHCGCLLVGVTERGRRNYVCRGYRAFGSGFCKKNWVAEAGLVTALVRTMQEAFLDPENLQRLRAEVAALEAEQRGDDNRGRLKRRADELAARIDQGNGRLLTLPADRLPGVVAKLREWEKEREAVLVELQRVEQESPRQDLEGQIKAAEHALWQLQDALQAEDAPLLRELFRELIDRVELRWVHRQAGKLTRTHFAGAVVTLRSSPEASQLYPSAARTLQVLLSPADLGLPDPPPAPGTGRAASA